MTYSHMSRPKKYHTQEARLQAIRENSNRYYTKHRHDISARRKLAYQTKSSHHVGPETAPKVPPPPDPFPKFNAEVLKILQQFEDFLVGKTPSDYVKSLLRCYFKDSSRRQGEIGLFVEPLDVLYKMQEAHSAVKNTAVAFGAVSGYAFLVELIDSIGMKFERARLRSSKNDQQADNIGMLEIPGVAATTTSVVCYSTPLGTFHSDHLKRSKSPCVGNITKEQREFLRPYIAYYRRLKDRAREHPKPYSIFQSRLWLLWKDRFRSQLQPPDLADKSAREHWYTCRQKDLAAIIRILEMWEPFYTAGHVREIAQRARVKAKVAKAAKKRDSRREVVSGEQIRRSERMPKPRKLVDNAEGDLL
ncbi:hypothetical protein IW261DRAFT_1418343 [Armillaria novae-zelandiae]|uniref:Uncharacterized protein n=1 Tax=Armillaria novae-zelandiae TaxID=153914 RepID=A0AA39PBL2_9AGAR|nr:hypothetical protein IW261DRAFT_1418343 [Armillaria novae-zelandiae]